MRVLNLEKCGLSTLKEYVFNFVIILFYYFFSILLTFYNKKYIVIYPYPLSITLTHLCMKFTIALLCRRIYCLIYKTKRKELAWKEYWKISIPGFASSLDIGLSNWSFKFINISLYTMTKSTSIVFILFFSLILKLEKKRLSLVLVVTLIAIGLGMFTYKSTQFHLTGFLLCLSASFVSGIRWTSSQIVSQEDKFGLQNPIDFIYHIQPWMILAMFPLATILEGVHVMTDINLMGFKERHVAIHAASIVLAGGVIAFALESSEYLMISRTSGLTLCVAGILKEVLTISMAVVINHDSLNAVNVLGLVTCIAGIGAHTIIKFRLKNDSSTTTSQSDTEILLEEQNQ